MKTLQFALACLYFLLGTLVTSAQTEQQVPFDNNGTVFTIDRAFNDKHLIFDGAAEFYEARLFKRTDSTFVLELTRLSGKSYVRDRQELSAQDVAELKSRISKIVDFSAATDHLPKLDQSGRSALLWGSTLWSLFYYGTAISYAISGPDFNIGATYLIAGGLGYLVPMALTGDAEVSTGASTLALGGMFQGAIHGWLLGAVILGPELDVRFGSALSSITGVAETVAGLLIGKNMAISDGRASAINTSSFYGMVCGGLLGITAFGPEFNGAVGARVSSGLALAGSVGGMLVGNALANDQNLTPADGTMYATSGLLGLTLPYAVMMAFADSPLDGRIISGAGIVGAIGGLWLGTELVRGHDFDSDDASTVVLGTLAGAVSGIGVGLLLKDARLYTPLMWAGAASGFGLAIGTRSPRPEGRSFGHLQFNINPVDLALGARSAIPIPVGSLTYRF